MAFGGGDFEVTNDGLIPGIASDVTDIKTYLSGEGIQGKFDFSKSGPVEEGAFQLFAISVIDTANGAITSANIDITSISAVMSKSTGGGAFSAVGITQPTFSKENGRVYCNYQFLTAQWEAGDMYKLEVSGIALTIGSDTQTVPYGNWSNIITELVNLETKVDSIQTDIGDPSARTNFKDIEDMIGIPDAANSCLDDMLRTGYDSTAITSNNDGSVMERLEWVSANIPSLTDKGVVQIATTTEDLQQAAASYDLLTGTTQAVILEGLSIKLPNVNVSDDATITSISIQTDDVTPSVIISSATGAKANLTAEAELSWTGFVKIAVGTKIQLTINGGAADAPTVCSITAKYRAIADGGTLA